MNSLSLVLAAAILSSLTGCTPSALDADSVKSLIEQTDSGTQNQKWNDARLSFAKVSALAPDNRQVWIAGCRLHAKLGEWEKAIECADKALSLNQNDAEALGYKGWAESEITDWDKALADFNKAIALNDNNAELYVGRANVHQNLENFKEVLSDCQKAIAINPNIV